MNAKVWNTCNDLDVVTSNQEAAVSAVDFILEGMERAAVEARKGDQDAGKAFLGSYGYYSGMLYLLLGVLREQNKELHRLIDKAMEEARA